MSGEYPFTHGWLGWSVYFDELGRAVDIYRDTDSYTGEHIDSTFVRKRLPFNAYYENTKNYEVNTIFPVYVKDGIAKANYWYDTTKEMFEKIKNCCLKEGKQFIYSYCNQPDSTMHDYGVSSKETKTVIDEITELMEELNHSLKDTLIIITSDHGHIDIDGYVEIYKDKKILDCLARPMTLEPRATSFKIKEEKKEDFKRIFKEHYGKEFKLFEVDYLIKKGVFGPVNEKNRELLGDYISVCKTNKQFLFSDSHPKFKGHHTSLTKEMLVPLIIIDKK